MEFKTEECKPFLRWAGGKNWLVRHIDYFLPKGGYRTYHEPFIGGGAIYFYLKPQKAIISDFNSELIDTYLEIKNNVKKVIDHLAAFENTKECYYKTRDESYTESAKRAARFIFLNKTSFNGIYRVNLDGKYNVPYGYKKNYFIDETNLFNISKQLENTKILHCDFAKTINNIKENDLVFLDPPYTVTHNNNGFIKYNSKLFNESSQLRLSKMIDTIESKGAYYILTNAAHEWVRNTFERKNNKIYTLSRASSIGGLNAKRGKYNEYLITNIET